MMNNNMLHMVSLVLLIVGGLNWLARGLFDWGIENLLGGPEALLSRAIFILVGLAAVYEMFGHKHRCKSCEVKATPMGGGMSEGS